MPLFKNRREAAEELARDLLFLKHENPVILGIATGGVPIASVVAERLEAPLDVLLLERLTAPKSPDHVVGAVDEHGRISLIKSTARWHQLSTQQLIQPAREAFRDLQRRRGRLRATLPEIDVRDCTAIIISQGVSSGARMLGAIASVRDRGAAKIIAAAPAGESRATWPLHDLADFVVVPHQPARFKNVDDLYADAPEVTDEMMLALLERWAAKERRPQSSVRTLVMKVTGSKGQLLCCEIDLPPHAQRGSGPYPAVIFAHGFESDARSPRSVPISRRLAKRGVIGVRMDFTGHGRSEGAIEEATEEQMLSDLYVVFENVSHLQEVDGECIGLNGAGTGAMIALRYAGRQSKVQAMVIRGPVCGREIDAARKTHAPTLIVHAEHDTALEEHIDMLDRELAASHRVLRIPDSNRLFSDPISREMMVSATVDWLADHLLRRQSQRPRQEQAIREEIHKSSGTPADHLKES